LTTISICRDACVKGVGSYRK